MNKRRSLLLALTGATTLPASWKKPVVNAVVLPAHAFLSGCPSLLFGPYDAICDLRDFFLQYAVFIDEAPSACPAVRVISSDTMYWDESQHYLTLRSAASSGSPSRVEIQYTSSGGTYEGIVTLEFLSCTYSSAATTGAPATHVLVGSLGGIYEVTITFAFNSDPATVTLEETQFVQVSPPP